VILREAEAGAHRSGARPRRPRREARGVRTSRSWRRCDCASRVRRGSWGDTGHHRTTTARLFHICPTSTRSHTAAIIVIPPPLHCRSPSQPFSTIAVRHSSARSDHLATGATERRHLQRVAVDHEPQIETQLHGPTPIRPDGSRSRRRPRSSASRCRSVPTSL
jgi:hypothetical protein